MNNKRWYYILDEEGNVVAVDDIRVWGEWFETADRTVEKTVVGDLTVSTVFLSLDHSFGYGDPVLWETMIYEEKPDDTHIFLDFQERYTSVEVARERHKEIVEITRKVIDSEKDTIPDSLIGRSV